MSRFDIDAYLGEDGTPATRAWEKWAGKVAVGDRCEAGGRPATVTALTDDFLWVVLDGRSDPEPFEWDDAGPLDAI